MNKNLQKKVKKLRLERKTVRRLELGVLSDVRGGMMLGTQGTGDPCIRCNVDTHTH